MAFQHACGLFALLGVCLMSFTPTCNGGNILVYPLDGSHWVNMKILLEELHARGHSFTVIRASNSWYIEEKSHLYTSVSVEMEESFEDLLGDFVKDNIKVSKFESCWLVTNNLTIINQSLDLICPSLSGVVSLLLFYALNWGHCLSN